MQKQLGNLFDEVLCCLCTNSHYILADLNVVWTLRYTVRSEAIHGNQKTFENDEKSFYFTLKTIFVLKNTNQNQVKK